ncbi:MAG: hypothetical protein DRJ07_08480 [Bacteroidetes bacterium]|nr:MAG: hypothetical protein DRJ07_08480 [Bacteroidota bacterium]
MKVRFLLYLIIAILSIFDIVFICPRITGKDTRMVDADSVVAKNDKLKELKGKTHIKLLPHTFRLQFW